MSNVDSSKDRAVLRVVRAQPTSDGAGVRLNRAMGTSLLPMLDPFLMLDEFRSDDPNDYIAGFPSHPHRGFETVSYMLAGSLEHKDSVGNTGLLRAGSIQWMTAGRGIIHSEMPKQENGLMWGFQLWVNLPASDKMVAPRYQDIAPELVPEVRAGDAKVRVLAGEASGATGPITGIVTSPLMLDVTIPAGGTFQQALPATHNAFLYVFEGAVLAGPKAERVRLQELAVLGPGETFRARSEEGGRFLLLAAKPLGEPVARYGPFVMNTEKEIRQAMLDFQGGKLAS